MDKDAFEKFLDASWQAFRKQLLEAYPADADAGPSPDLRLLTGG